MPLLTVRYETLVITSLATKEALEVDRLHTRKSSSNSEIQNDPSLDSVCLCLIEIYRVLGGVVDLSGNTIYMTTKRQKGIRKN